MRRWTWLAVIAAAQAAACRPHNGPAEVAATRVDLPRSYQFAPAAIVVPAGTRVTFTNHDVFTHAVQFADSGATPRVMAPGDSISVLLEGSGVHAYVCPFHPQMMKGTIRVAGS